MRTYPPRGEYTRRSITCDGVTHCFAEATPESDETVVLLHSGEFGATAETSWERTIESLSDSYHVIAPDILGYGYSDKLFDFEDVAELRLRHLDTLVRTLGIERAHFVGHSLGAGYIPRLVTSSDFHVTADKLVIAHGGTGPPRGLGKVLKRFDGTLERVEDIMRVLFYQEWWDDEYLEWKRDLSRLPGHWQCVAGFTFDPPFEASTQPPPDIDLDLIRNETLIVGGQNDELTPPDRYRKLADDIGENATLELIDGAGHGAQLDRPDRFNDLLLDFL